MNYTPNRIFAFCVILVLSIHVKSSFGQLGLTYTTNYGYEQYSSIRNLPGTVNIVDTTNFSSGWVPGAVCGSGTYLLNFGTIPFNFYFDNEIAAAILVSPVYGQIEFNNGGQIRAAAQISPLVARMNIHLDGTTQENGAWVWGVDVGNYVNGGWYGSNAAQVVQILDYDSTSNEYDDVVFSVPTQVSSIIANDNLFYMTGRLFYNTIGIAPNRRFVIEWFNYHDFEANSSGNVSGISNRPMALYNFQIHLHETTNKISIHFGDSREEDSILGGSGLVGLFNALNECDQNIVSGNPDSLINVTEWCGASSASNCSSSGPQFNHNDNFYICWSNQSDSDLDNDGFSPSDGDCDDLNALISPDSPELCNGLDDNCNGIQDEGFDLDGDSFSICSGDCDDNNQFISPISIDIADGLDNDCDELIDEDVDNDGDGWTIQEGDCDDTNPDVNPGAVDIDDNIDNDCDQLIDENTDSDGDGLTPEEGDCDDANAAVNTNAEEICNGIDDNCDGTIDEGFDGDGDTYSACNGDCDDTNLNVYPGAPDIEDDIDNDCDTDIDENADNDGDGFTPDEGDCDDTNPNVYLGAVELCNGIDDDCDGVTDEGFDADNDGVTVCEGDCDDTNAAINPASIEICNGLDDNCNTQTDEGFDEDVDTFTTCNGDCDDTNASVYPGAPDIEDGIDNDCDTDVDEDADNDDDGFTPAEGDCDDENPVVFPGAVEICNGFDDDCDGSTDEDLDCGDAPFFIPNGISPNSDGLNDVWILNGIENFPGCSVKIVNRWGQLIFESTGYTQPWDGIYQGSRLPSGDYYYTIQLNDKQIFTGFVSLK